MKLDKEISRAGRRNKIIKEVTYTDESESAIGGPREMANCLNKSGREGNPRRLQHVVRARLISSGETKPLGLESRLRYNSGNADERDDNSRDYVVSPENFQLSR